MQRTRHIRAVRPNRRSPPLRLTQLSRAALATLLLGAPLLGSAQSRGPVPTALPTGPQVVQGQASIATTGNQMLVKNSAGAVLNWQSFSIGSGAGVHFEQTNASSKVLNRVLGNDPSAIFGSLSSNGQVWLLNPHGILFGQSAQVNVAGLVASTLRLSDADFAARRFRFAALDGAYGGSVRNEGTLSTTFGGHVVLLGEHAANSGSMSAPGGQVALVGARSVELVDTGLPNLSVRVNVPAGEALNLGSLAAPGGRVDVHAAIVNQQGLVQAGGIGRNAAGEIVLHAADTLTLDVNSKTAADGAAHGDGGNGGTVKLLGAQIALLGGAQVSANAGAGASEASGGSIYVGGGREGKDTSIPNARAVYVAPGAALNADAADQGRGGSIVLWSNEATRAYGRFSATGGRLGGDGGFIETSGGWLDARPAKIDLRANTARGAKPGTWLLDPNDIVILTGAQNSNISGGPIFTSTNDNSVISTETLATALNAGTSVTVATGTGGTNTQQGDIRMEEAVLNVAPPQGVTLTLRAARDIVVSSSTITSTGAPLSLNLVSAGSGIGAIEIRGSTIATAGGDITLGGAIAQKLPLPGGLLTLSDYSPAVGYTPGQSFSSTSSNGRVAVDVQSSTLTLGAGTFKATGYTTVDNGDGINLGGTGGGATTIAARQIELVGVSNVANARAVDGGVLIGGQQTQVDATQAITIDGAGQFGIAIESGARVALNGAAGGGAALTLRGLGIGFGGVSFFADDLETGIPGRGTRVTANNASVSVTGNATAGPGIGLYNDQAAPGPLLDLAGATSATFLVERSAAVQGFPNAFNIIGVDLELPAGGSTSFTGDLGLFMQNTIVGGNGGSVSFAAQGITFDSALLASAGTAMAVNFATTGNDPGGVKLNNTSIVTNGGDVRFGSVQQGCTTILGCTSGTAPWLNNANGQFVQAGLEIVGSAIDAGTGRVHGGGASSVVAGVLLDSSTIDAARIELAGRSDAVDGIGITRGSYTATRLLTLDGDSAGAFAGVSVNAGTTLNLTDSTRSTGSALRLAGTARGAEPGLLLLGGNVGTSDETLIYADGGSLTLRGTALQGGSTGLLVGATNRGGLLINGLGATSMLLEGASPSRTGGGLALQAAALIGPQASANAYGLELIGLGNFPGLSVQNSSVGSGSAVRLAGHAVFVADSTLSGDAGLTLHAIEPTSGTPGSPVVVRTSTLSTSAAGSQLRIGNSTGGPAPGLAGNAGGTGVLLESSTLTAGGSGSLMRIDGRGADAGGNGVDLYGSILSGDTVGLQGRGVVDGDGVLLRQALNVASQIQARVLTIDGTSADQTNPAAGTHAGVVLREGAGLNLTGGGSAVLSGDYVVLDGVAAPVSVLGNPTTFDLVSTRSLLVRLATLDFRNGAGTNVTFTSDSDADLSGRQRLASSTVFTSGGDFVATGGAGYAVGFVEGQGAGNTAVLAGIAGINFSGLTVDAGSGLVRLAGQGATDNNALTGQGFAGLIATGGNNNLSGGRIELAGRGGNEGSGLDVGVGSLGGTLNLSAASIGIDAQARGAFPAIVANAPSTWAASGGALAITGTGGGIDLRGLTLSGSPVTIVSAGATNLIDLPSITGSAVTVRSAGTLNIDAASSTITATSALIDLTGNFSLTGGLTFQAARDIFISSTNGLVLAPRSGFTASPTFSAANSLTLEVATPAGLAIGPGVALDNTALNTALATMPAGAITTLRTTGAGSANALNLTGPVVSLGKLIVQSNNIVFGAGAQFTSNAAEDALVVGGSSTRYLETFANNAGPNALNAPNGRWVLLANNPASTVLGGLGGTQTAFNLGAQPWGLNAAGNFVTPQPGNAIGFAVSTATASGGGPLAGLVTRVYDTTASVLLDPQSWVITGLVPGDTLLLNGINVATLQDKNAGTAKPVSLNAGSIFTVQDSAGRPVFGYELPVFSANITPAPLTVSGVVVANKTYDALTGGTLASFGTVQPLAGDTVTVGGAPSVSFADKNVGTGKSVTVGPLQLTGIDAANYTLTNASPGGLTANITPALLAVTGVTATSRVYDTTTVATLGGTAAISPFAGDLVLLNGGAAAASFADKNVGIGKSVSASGFAITGLDAGNYTLAQPTGLTANITPAPLVVAGVVANNKVYDAGTAASLGGTAAVAPLGTDAVGVAGTAVASFGTKTVGIGKAVTASGYTLVGIDAANYSVVQPTGLVANITPALLGVGPVAAASKAYDGTTTTTASASPTGVLAGDVVSLSLSANFNDRNAGTNKPVAYTATAAGIDAGNYSLVAPSGSTTANIAPATLTYTAAPATAVVGSALPTLTGTVTGFVAGETLAGATTGTLVWTSPGSTTGSVAGRYAITGSGLAALNYLFVQAPGNATALTLTAATINEPATVATQTLFIAALQSVSLPTITSTPTSGRVLDAMQAFGFGSAGNGESSAGRAGGGATAGSGAESGSAAGGPASPGASGTSASAAAGAGPAGSTEVAGAQAPGAPGSAGAPGSGPSAPGAPGAPLSPEAAAAAASASLISSLASGSAGDGLSFRSVNLSLMSRDEIQSMLAARASYKRKVFAQSLAKLEQDPSLADVRACRSEEELSTGNCVITEALKNEIQAKAARGTASATSRARRAPARKVKVASVPNIERKLALLIGVNKYSDKAIPELVGAVPDTKAVAALLETRLGYETMRLENPTREQIVRAFNQLALEADANDSVVVYFAGHGVVVPVEGIAGVAGTSPAAGAAGGPGKDPGKDPGKGAGSGYWLPSDSNSENAATWLANADIARLIGLIGARQTMLVSDSCYSGSLAGTERVQVDARAPVTDLLSRRAVVVMSSGGDEPVADEGKNGHSVFSYHLMQGMRGLAEYQVGTNVFEQVRNAVVKDFPQTPQYGAQRSAGHQGNTDYLFERRELDAAAP